MRRAMLGGDMLGGDMLGASAALLGAPPLRGLRMRKKRAGPVPCHPRMESGRPPTSRPSTSRRRGPGRLPPLRTGVCAAAPAALASAVSVLVAPHGDRRAASPSRRVGGPAGRMGKACRAARPGLLSVPCRDSDGGPGHRATAAQNRLGRAALRTVLERAGCAPRWIPSPAVRDMRC
jgi:hypothetical protein